MQFLHGQPAALSEVRYELVFGSSCAEKSAVPTSLQLNQLMFTVSGLNSGVVSLAP